MMQAYHSGDPYLEFGKQAGLIPESGTKETHEGVRDRCKSTCLGVGYGMGERTLAGRLGCTLSGARHLLERHRATYPRFWSWSDGAIRWAELAGRIETAFGWPLNVRGTTRPRTLRNFPAQANGADMLRIACILATNAGVEIVATVHDAILIESSLDGIDAAVEVGRDCMRRASELVLAGFPLRTDAKLIRWPDRFVDRRGATFWARMMGLLGELEMGVG